MTDIYVISAWEHEGYAVRAAFLDYETAVRLRGLWGEDTVVNHFTPGIASWFERVREGQSCYVVEMDYSGNCDFVNALGYPQEPRLSYTLDFVSVVVLALSESDACVEAKAMYDSVRNSDEFANALAVHEIACRGVKVSPNTP